MSTLKNNGMRSSSAEGLSFFAFKKYQYPIHLLLAIITNWRPTWRYV